MTNYAQRPVTRSFDIFFDLRLNKRLSKQSWGWWFEKPASSSWRHGNDTGILSPDNACDATLSAMVRHITDKSFFVQQLINSHKKENIRGIHCCALVRGNILWPMESPYKGQVMQKVFPCHVVSCSPPHELLLLWTLNGNLMKAIVSSTALHSPEIGLVDTGDPLSVNKLGMFIQSGTVITLWHCSPKYSK